MESTIMGESLGKLVENKQGNIIVSKSYDGYEGKDTNDKWLDWYHICVDYIK